MHAYEHTNTHEEEDSSKNNNKHMGTRDRGSKNMKKERQTLLMDRGTQTTNNTNTSGDRYKSLNTFEKPLVPNKFIGNEDG
jgi:hypothetical protein